MGLKYQCAVGLGLIALLLTTTVASKLQELIQAEATGVDKKDCGENESHVGCEQTCADIVNWSLSACRVQWDRTRCFCKAGFLRNDAGRCIPRQECPQQKCPKNAKLHWCGGHRCASKQCDPDLSCGSGYECIPGCRCENGFFMNQNGDCVTKSSCPPPPSCPEHEMYTSCLKCYEETCQTRGPVICVSRCISKGCYCAPGFVRNEQGKCVDRGACPEQSGQKPELWTWD